MGQISPAVPLLIAAVAFAGAGGVVAWGGIPVETEVTGPEIPAQGELDAAAGEAPRRAHGAASGADLVAELGCGACHTGVPLRIGGVPAPALGHAGLRYTTAYLFDYLKSPRRVRSHIGAARMPDFHLDERESLALALYLSTLEEGDRARVRPEWLRLPWPRGEYDADALMSVELGCTGCHSLQGRGGSAAPDLALAGARLRTGWVRDYLADPQSWDPRTPMPSLFYTDDRASERRRERMADADGKLRAVATRMAALGREQSDAWTTALEEARSAHPEVDATLGRRIFIAQNCAGCHTRSPARAWPNAPDLTRERSRVRPDWLSSYLGEPHPIRPFGHYPGSGSRMPDFHLTPAEVDSISEFLLTLDGSSLQEAQVGPAPATPLSGAERRRAEALLRDRLPCLGCHALDSEGGRIGPDLTTAGVRLRRAWIRSIIADPQHASPGTSMPAVPMPDGTRELLIAYLAGRTARGPATDRLSLADHPIHFPAGRSTARGVYQAYCAACHGTTGDGDGYNSRYLPVPPAPHSDGTLMARRPDDTLFDGTHAGGAVLGRSHRMPAFGATLNDAQIRGLVGYIRELCDCEPPAWSTDGSRGPNTEGSR